MQALIGDSTDNVPGVPGIGVKTAAQLITEYGDLETLLARAGEIKQQKRRESLIEYAEQARLSKRLVTLDQNVTLDVPIEDSSGPPAGLQTAGRFLKAMEFTTLTRRVAGISGIEATEIEPDSRVASTGAKADSRQLSWPGLTRLSIRQTKRVWRSEMDPGSGPVGGVRSWRPLGQRARGLCSRPR